jgi:hypothetical protein
LSRRRKLITLTIQKIDDLVRSYTGSDAFGANAMAAVSLCQQWCG